MAIGQQSIHMPLSASRIRYITKERQADRADDVTPFFPTFAIFSIFRGICLLFQLNPERYIIRIQGADAVLSYDKLVSERPILSR